MNVEQKDAQFAHQRKEYTALFLPLGPCRYLRMAPGP